MRTVMNMDLGWDFHRGEEKFVEENSHSSSYSSVKAGNAKGFAGTNPSADGWRQVDLPHDYLAESGFSPDYLLSHGYRERCSAWYRKTFVLPKKYEGKQVFICFEGTAVNAEFYFNGSLIDRSFSAYTETFFDVTDRLYFDGSLNTLAVHVIGTEFEGWWYEGAGIYRHVKLYIKDKTHIAHNGFFAKPVLKAGTKNSWTVEIETEVENSAYAPDTVSVKAELFDGDKCVASSLSKPVCVDFTSRKSVFQKLDVGKVHRWDVDDPYLYRTKITIVRNGEEIDSDECRTGFRTIKIDKDTGFWLNGKNIKIKGTCNHQDHAGVGVAVPDSVQYYRVRRLKEMGSNGYRCSHNLPTKEVLDACDEYGMIVMDENRRFETRTEVLSYVETMVKRDRNHPSVCFWSLFNEEPLQNTEEGRRIFLRMRSVVDHLDDSRPVTGAINGTMEGAGQEMDVVGMNYSIGRLKGFHEQYPNLPMIGSENNSAVTTRGCYQSDRENLQVLNNYDEEVVPWGQSIRETWDFVRKNPWFAGIFIWTGFDYRGEPTPFTWPSVSSQFGIMDTCGFPKDSFYFNKACFTNEPMVHLMPHWNFKKGEIVRVVAITNCEEAELFVNGKSLGRKKADVCAQPEWQVPFEAGRIFVKAYNKGKCVAKDQQKTAKKPARIVITPAVYTVSDRGQDAMILNISVLDKYGTVVPTADDLIRFEIKGDAALLGVGNGDPNSHEPDNEPMRKAYCGYCQAIVRALPGAVGISVRAYADGLEDATFVPVIERCEKPHYLATTHVCEVRNLTAMAPTDKKPDPLMFVADDDMNSFTPLATNDYQPYFTRGYMLCRAFVNAPERVAGADSEMPYVLKFDMKKATGMEIYVNTRKIFCEYTDGNFRLPAKKYPFFAEAGEKLEFRILLYLNEENKDRIGGIRGKLTIEANLK